jgi:hypothetical protein
MSWRNLSLLLAALCAFQTWRGCQRAPSSSQVADAAECAPAPSNTRSRSRSSWDEPAAARERAKEEPEDTAGSGLSFNGFKLPAWTLWLAPHPGENMLAYRDRMLPLAQAALAPHRSRVARGRDDFAAKVGLDGQQREKLDAAVQDAAGTIQDKVMSALLGGELTPSTFKPMTGVALARDVLDSIDRANQRFMSTLRDDQRATLAQHPFDFADYLLFSARWEDALCVTN